MSDQLVYVWGPESELHIGVRHDGRVLTGEACNADDIVGTRIIGESIDDAPAGIVRCRNCFRTGEPHAAVQPDAEPVTS